MQYILFLVSHLLLGFVRLTEEIEPNDVPVWETFRSPLESSKLSYFLIALIPLAILWQARILKVTCEFISKVVSVFRPNL